MKPFALIATLTAFISGCATLPAPTYVSPNTYQAYDCNGLASEYNRVNHYINTSHSQGGLTMSGVGIGIGIGSGGIYPSVNVGVGSANTGNRNNLAIALGERDAIVQAGRIKQCNFVTGIKLSTEK